MKKALLVFMLIIIMISVNLNIYASNPIAQVKDSTNDIIKKTIDNYFQYRQDSFSVAENKIIASSKESILHTDTSNGNIFTDEKKRIEKLKNIEKS